MKQKIVYFEKTSVLVDICLFYNFDETLSCLVSNCRVKKMHFSLTNLNYLQNPPTLYNPKKNI